MNLKYDAIIFYQKKKMYDIPTPKPNVNEELRTKFVRLQDHI